jgi:hypothetical protein
MSRFGSRLACVGSCRADQWLLLRAIRYRRDQGLSRLAERPFRQVIGGYSDKPAGFVRSARRFWAPETSCFRVRFA